MKTVLVLPAILFFLAGPTLGPTVSEQTVFFLRAELFDAADPENVRAVREMAAAGVSEADILDSLLEKYFDRDPKLSESVPVYRTGAYRVTETTRGGEKTSVRIEEPVTGFAIRMDYSGGVLVRKEHACGNETIDEVTYLYRDGRRVSARSRLYGERTYP